MITYLPRTRGRTMARPALLALPIPLLLLSLLALPAQAQPDPAESTFDDCLGRSPANSSAPAGSRYSFHGVLRDANGDPVPNYPFEDIALHILSPCANPTVLNPDSGSSIDGEVVWSAAALEQGGACSGVAVVEVRVAGQLFATLDAVRSPDVDGDGTVDADDWDVVGAAIEAGSPLLEGDLNCDGAIDDADATFFADHGGPIDEYWYQGQLHTVLGGATLVPGESMLTVAGLDSLGNDGVMISHGGGVDASLIDKSTSNPVVGGWVEASWEGHVDGAPDQDAFNLRLESVPGATEVVPDFSSLGSSTYMLELVLDGQVVHTETGLSGMAYSYEGSGGVCTLCPLEGNGCKYDWPMPMEVQAADGTLVMADGSRMWAESPTANAGPFQRTLLRGTAVDIHLGEEGVGFSGLAHRTLGDARFSTSPDTLAVNHIDGDGDDGVMVDLLADVAGVTTSLANLDPSGSHPLSAYLRIGVHDEAAKRGPGPPHTELLIDALQGELGQKYGLTPDFTPQGIATFTTEVYDAGVLVASVSGLSGVGATMDTVNDLGPELSVTQEYVDEFVGSGWQSTPTWTVRGPTSVTIPGHGDHACDEVRFVADGTLGSTTSIAHVSFVAADLPEVRLLSHEVQTAAAQQEVDFAGLRSAAMGLADLTVVGDTLFVENLGSSGLDGVAVSGGESQGLALSFGPTTPDSLPDGGTIDYEFAGSLDGAPAAYLESMHVARNGATTVWTPDFSALGVDTYTLSVLDDGVVVDEVEVNATAKSPVQVHYYSRGDRVYKIVTNVEEMTTVQYCYELVEPDQQIQIELPGHGPVGGDVLMVEFAIDANLTSTALAVRSSGFTGFSLVGGEVANWDLFQGAEGGARLTSTFDGDTSTLSVDNLGSSGIDGFTVAPGGAGSTTEHLALRWDQLDTGTAGATLACETEVEVFRSGSIETAVQSLLFERLTADPGSPGEITVDYTDLGSTTQLVQVVSGGQVVHETSGNTGAIGIFCPPDSTQWNAEPDGCEKGLAVIGPDTTACFTVVWDEPVLIDIGAKAQAIGDRVNILAEGPDGTYRGIRRWTVGLADYPHMTVTDISTALPAPACTCPRSWNQLIASGPPPRRQHASAWDAARGELVVFGGRDDGGLLGDTWVWSDGVWTQRLPATSPTPRYGARLVNDTASGALVLHGGITDGSSVPGDTWIWDGTGWSEVAGAGGPTVHSQGMAYDPVREVVVLYGGGTGSGRSRATWEFDGTTWTRVIEQSAPGFRSHLDMVWNGDDGMIHLFGGRTSGGSVVGGHWTYDGSGWTQAASGPPARSNPAMVQDPDCGELYLYGGRSGGSSLADFWHYDGEGWTQIAATAPPGDLDQHSFTFIPGSRLYLLLGGRDSAGDLGGGTWGYGCGIATAVGPDTAPPNLRLALDKAFPNPFNPRITIRFSVPGEGRAPVRLGIYDLRGRRVAMIVDAPLPAGRHERIWNGSDARGRTVSSGVYFLRLQARDAVVTDKITLLR